MKFARAFFPGVDDVFQDRYRIVAELGSGGMGTVYKAVQLATGQQVAIKVLRLAGARDAKTVEKRVLRLEREMRLCAQLHHPNIVGLIDFGRADDGSVYSVFEFVPGKNLEEVLVEEGTLAPVEARHLMLQVLDALACAHGQGVIHRDLKPSNIMVISTGARRNALVLDFGIGVVTDGAPGLDHSRLTATNEVLGTIAYASPEQLFSKPTSPASDLYSWGLVFIECLTGIPVVHGASMMDALFKHMAASEVALPPALLSHSLGRLIRSVVAKNVEDRPASAREVMKRLEDCQVGDLRRQELVLSPPPSKPSERLSSAPPPAPAPKTNPTTEPISRTKSIEPAPGKASEPPSQSLSLGDDPLAGERRQVTAVCATLSVAAGEDGSVDIEEVDQLLHTGQETCARIAARFRGHPTGAMGNQTIFWFGFPAADEDDARRAARAALEMIADTERDAAQLAAQHKAHLQIRIGIHTGIVVSRAAGAPATHRLGASFGTTSNVAAQLSATAAPGEVTVSDATQRLLRNFYAFSSLGSRPVAAYVQGGAGATVETHRLEWPISTIHSMATERPEAPLIGRETELEVLLQRWEEARRGRGQVVFMTGEVGIGKSRLVRELASRIRSQPHRWLECRSGPEDQNSALHPIVEMLERTLELGDDEPPAGKLAKLQTLLRSLDFTLDDNVPLFSKLLGINLSGGHSKKHGQTKHEVAPPLLKEQLLNALLSLFFELSEREAVVLVAEDLHWTDPTTLELFTKIVQEVGSARMLVIFSARPAFVPPWKLSEVLQMQLARFGREEISQMVAGLSEGGEPPPSGILDQIEDRTDGVPLFVEELTRMMAESGLLSEPPGGRPSLRSGWTVSVPGTLRDLLTARLDRLGRARGTAQIAAALGREFSFEVLGAVSPLSARQLQEDLDALVAADLVHRKRRAKGQSYAFRHALIRDTAYESMLKRARQKVHAEIVTVLRERFSDTPAARPEMLALHLAEAGREAEAVENILKAAEASVQRSANPEAIGHAQQAQAWLEAIEPGRERAALELHVQNVLITALFALKGPGATEVEAEINRAQALVAQVGDGPQTIQTLIKIATYYQMRARLAEAITAAEHCRVLAERAGDTGAQILALSLLAQGYLYTGRHEEGRSAALRALALFDPDEHTSYSISTQGIDGRVSCYGALSLALWFLGQPDQGLAAAQRGLALMEKLDHAHSIALALVYLASVHRYRREPGELGAVCGRLHEISQRHGLHLGAWAGIFFGTLTGDVEVPKQILAGFSAYGHLFGMPYNSSTIAETDAAAGRYVEALARIDECILTSERTGEIHYLPELFRLKGTFLLKEGAAGAEDAALVCFRRALELSRAHKSRICELRALTALASLLDKSGGAEEIREPLTALCSELVEGQSLLDMQEARAALAALPA